MKLEEAISRLAEFPDEGTLFLEPIQGQILPASRVVILELTEEELRLPVAQIANARAPGTQYFLEVFIAKEVIEGWQRNHADMAPNLEQALESIIYYSQHDAYPPSFFG